MFTASKILKYDDVYIEQVEEIEFTNKQELYAREGFYIRNHSCVNKCVPDRTPEETKELNHECHKKHIQNNAEYKKKQNLASLKRNTIRYETDENYRNKIKTNGKERYQRLKDLGNIQLIGIDKTT